MLVSLDLYTAWTTRRVMYFLKAMANSFQTSIFPILYFQGVIFAKCILPKCTFLKCFFQIVFFENIFSQTVFLQTAFFHIVFLQTKLFQTVGQHIQYILKQCFRRAHFPKKYFQNSTSSRTLTFLLAGQPHLQSLFRFALNNLKNALKIYLHIVTIEGRAITVSFLSRLMLVVMTRIGDGNGEVYLYEKSTLSWGPSVELTIFENKLASSTMC